MVASFQHFRGYDCPVCQGARKDCRRSTRSGLVHCRDHSVTDVPGWRFIKQDALGFNMWAVDDGRDRHWTEDRLDNWKRQREAQLLDQQTREAKRLAELLSVDERDRQYRIVNDQLILSARHRQVLLERRLSEAEIDFVFGLGAVRTWSPGQSIPGVSPNLAGVNPIGAIRELIGSDGCVIAAFDPDGHITGYQRKTDKGQPKYSWVTSEWKGGSGPHLPNGELPLFVWKHPNATTINEVWLCEGALKSLLVALGLWRQGRTDIAVIGTASAARYGKKTLQDYLARLNCQNIKLFPDAGAIINPNIHKANQQTLEWCQKWNHSITVGWWGQVDKSWLDIDELLPDFSAITYLTPAEFLELAKQEQYRKKVRDAIGKLNSLTYPAIEVNQRYLDFNFPATDIQFVKSPTGTGKTELIKKLVGESRQRDNRLLLLGSRNGLLLQTCDRTGAEHIHDLYIDGEGRITTTLIKGVDSLALCIDSLFRLEDKDWEGATIVIDEAESVIEHLLDGNTCKRKRADLCTKLNKFVSTAINSGGRIILMDAGLTDLSINYIKSLAPANTPITGIKNSWKPEQGWDVTFDNGTTDGVRLRIKDNSAILKAILECLESGGIPAIATDSRIDAEALERELGSYGYPKGLRVDGNTSETVPEVKGFLAAPNDFLGNSKIPWLIYTPTAQNGLSIDAEYFTEVFGLFTGVLAVPDQMQMLARVRANIPRHVFTVPYGFNNDGCSGQLPEEIEQHLLQYHSQNNLAIQLAKNYSESDNPTDAERIQALNRMIDPETKQWNDPHLKTWTQLKARTNFYRANLRDELRIALIEAGHDVTDVCNSRESEIKDEFVNAKEEIKRETAEARHRGRNMDISEAWEILSTPGSKLEDRNAAYKAVLADKVPGLELTADFILKAQIEDKGRWLNQIKTDWMLKHPEVQVILDRKSWAWHLDQQFVALQDVNAYTLKLKALKALGIDELLDPERVFSCGDPATLAFIDRARTKRAKLRALNLSLTSKTNPIQFIQRLLGKIGANLECFQKQKDKPRLYRISKDYWHDPDRLAVLEAFDRKYAPLLASDAATQSGQAAEDRQHSQKEDINLGECCPNLEVIDAASPPPSLLDPPIQEQASVASEHPEPTPPIQDERWLPAEVNILGRWVAGFWRSAAGLWRSPIGKAPLVTPKEWRYSEAT